MALHIILGLLWLVAAARLALVPHANRQLLVVAAVATLWYVPAGTVIGFAVLLLAYCAADG